MSAARARRRLMQFERYRQHTLKLGASHLDARWGIVSHAHSEAWTRVDRQLSRDRHWSQPHRCPWTPGESRCPYKRKGSR